MGVASSFSFLGWPLHNLHTNIFSMLKLDNAFILWVDFHAWTENILKVATSGQSAETCGWSWLILFIYSLLLFLRIKISSVVPKFILLFEFGYDSSGYLFIYFYKRVQVFPLKNIWLCRYEYKYVTQFTLWKLNLLQRCDFRFFFNKQYLLH